MSEIDPERLLAAVARRLLKLGWADAALSLADTSVVAVRRYNEGAHFSIALVTGGDRYDALKDPAVWNRKYETDEHGYEYSEPAVIEQVLLDVLPPGTKSVEFTAAIRNEPVDSNWREPDSAGRLSPAPRAAVADLDLKRIPKESDLLLHLNRLNRLDQEPEEMIGAAKDLVEATAKVVLRTLGQPISRDDDVGGLSKRALAELNLHPETVAPTVKGAETMKRILGGLQQIAVGLAELRNMGYGTGHGQGLRTSGLTSRHSELAARAASAYVAFVLATLQEPDAPWTRKKPRIVAGGTANGSTRINPAFSVGQRVRHRTFGEGTITSARRTTGDEELVIDFDGRGSKKLLASLAQLEHVAAR